MTKDFEKLTRDTIVQLVKRNSAHWSVTNELVKLVMDIMPDDTSPEKVEGLIKALNALTLTASPEGRGN